MPTNHVSGTVHYELGSIRTTESQTQAGPAFQNKIKTVHLVLGLSKTRRHEVTAWAGSPVPHVTHHGFTSSPPSDHSSTLWGAVTSWRTRKSLNRFYGQVCLVCGQKLKTGCGLITTGVGGELRTVVRKSRPNGQSSEWCAYSSFMWREQWSEMKTSSWVEGIFLWCGQGFGRKRTEKLKTREFGIKKCGYTGGKGHSVWRLLTHIVMDSRRIHHR